MNWQFPHRDNLNPIQNEYYNSNDGMQAVWESLMSHYLNGNGSPQARQAMSRLYSPNQGKYTEWSMANPLTPKRFDQWLEENQSGVASQWNNSSRQQRGGDGRGYAVRARALW